MAKFLFGWELGGGLGHLARIGPLAAGLADRGHEVVAALRETDRAARFFDGVACIPAPHNRERSPEGVATGTYVDVLHEAGWSHPEGFAVRIAAWREIFDTVAPDVLVLDHSPTALLASLGRPLRRAQVGNGFESPPDVTPLPDLRPPGANPEPAQASEEAAMLDRVNAVLVASAVPPLPRLAALFATTDLNLLATFPEIDHYTGRVGRDYVGAWHGTWGDTPTWPGAGSPRVFGYLKPFRALGALVGLLGRTGLPTLIVVDAPANWQPGGAVPENVRMTPQLVDLEVAAREADVAILHASLGATIAMLLGGTPVLGIPLHMEQLQIARRIVEAGAGQLAAPGAPDQMAEGLRRLLLDGRFRKGAERFAAAHAGFDADAAVATAIERLEGLV